MKALRANPDLPARRDPKAKKALRARGDLKARKEIRGETRW